MKRVEEGAGELVISRGDSAVDLQGDGSWARCGCARDTCACSSGFWPCDWIWAECRNGCRPHAGWRGRLVIGTFARQKNSRMRCKQYEKERNDQGRIPFSADRREDQGTGRLEGQDALPCPRSHQTGCP